MVKSLPVDAREVYKDGHVKTILFETAKEPGNKPHVSSEQNEEVNRVKGRREIFGGDGDGCRTL